MGEDGEQGSPRTYAQAAANTWILELHLVREDKGNNYHVTKPELLRLIYKRLRVPVGGLVSYDDCHFKKIILELKAEVRADQLNVTQALEIKKGLLTKPLQSAEKPRMVKLYWCPVKMPNGDIDNVIKNFGEIEVGTKHVVMPPAAEDADPESWEALMAGVVTPEREVIMKITTNIPSLIMIRGQKVKVEYQGQPKTCSYCQKYWATCPGNGNVEKCKKNGGQEKSVKTAFKQLLNKIKGKEQNGQETSGPLVPGFIPDPDRVSFSNFPETWSVSDFMGWLDSKAVPFLEPMIFKGGRPGTFTITSVKEFDEELKLTGKDAIDMVDKLNGVEIDNGNKAIPNKRARVESVAAATPQKKPQVVTLGDDSSENTSV